MVMMNAMVIVLMKLTNVMIATMKMIMIKLSVQIVMVPIGIIGMMQIILFLKPAIIVKKLHKNTGVQYGTKLHGLDQKTVLMDGM